MERFPYLPGSQEAKDQSMRATNARNSPNKDGTDKVRGIDPITSEIDYSRDEVEFAMAIDAYKQKTGRKFPTCHEILGIARSLGYQKIGLTA